MGRTDEADTWEQGSGERALSKGRQGVLTDEGNGWSARADAQQMIWQGMNGSGPVYTVWRLANEEVQVDRGGQVMGNAGNAGVTAGQVWVAASVTTGDLVHSRWKTQTRKMWDLELADIVTMVVFDPFVTSPLVLINSALNPHISLPHFSCLWFSSFLSAPIRWWGRDPKVHPVFPWQPVRSDNPTRPHWNPEGYLLFAGLQRRPWY